MLSTYVKNPQVYIVEKRNCPKLDLGITSFFGICKVFSSFTINFPQYA